MTWKAAKRMRVLVACECSGAVRDDLRRLGHYAWSCDIQPCESDPEFHLMQDVMPLLANPEWDMLIAFPPCTHLATSGAAWFEQKRKDGRQQQGIDFFLAMLEAPIPLRAVENPVGIMNKHPRAGKPTQVIQPWYFGDPFQKTTCLWLRGGLRPLPHRGREEHGQITLFDDGQPLEGLAPVTHADSKGEMVTFDSGATMPKWYADSFKLPPAERAKLRSRTFPGIAKAMADTWGGDATHLPDDGRRWRP